MKKEEEFYEIINDYLKKSNNKYYIVWASNRSHDIISLKDKNSPMVHKKLGTFIKKTQPDFDFNHSSVEIAEDESLIFTNCGDYIYSVGITPFDDQIYQVD